MTHKVTHVIDCYDSPCVHFSRTDALYRGYCACGGIIDGTGTYTTTMERLVEHMNKCTEAIPSPDMPVKEVTADAA